MLEKSIILGTALILGFAVGWACRALAAKQRRRLEQLITISLRRPTGAKAKSSRDLMEGFKVRDRVS